MHLSPKRFGLRPRLIALVLAPAVLVAAFGGAAALRERRSATTLVEVRDDAGVLGRLTQLRTSLLEARAPIEIEVRALALGLSRDTALKLLDLKSLPSSDLGAVKAVLAQLPADARPFTAARVDTLRSAISRGASLEVIDQFDRLDALAQARWEQRVSALRGLVVRSGRTDLNRQVDDLEAATQAGSAGGVLLTRLADDWFGILAGNDRSVPARRALAIADQQLTDSLAVLVRSSDAPTAAAARNLSAARGSSPFSTAVEDAVAGRPPAPFANGVDVEQVARTFTDGLDLFGPILDVIDRDAASLRTSADHLSADASRSALTTLVGVIVVIGVLIAGSLLVAASFERPLSRLIEGLHDMGTGDLRSPPLDTTGPHEVAEAAAAFNDAVLILRMLEAKLDALAACDFGDPWLEEPLPGALGQAMARSVQVLAGSIVEREDLQERLAHQASHDALTGLSNRAAALEALDGAMARAKRTGSTLALAFLDLDGFKAANDTYGHQAGDEVLREVGRRLQTEARTGDLCARLGGDEFVIIAENVDGADGATALARRVGAALAAPIRVDAADITIAASIGLALLDERGDRSDQLLARADIAAYQAKRLRTGVELFDETMRSRLRSQPSGS